MHVELVDVLVADPYLPMTFFVFVFQRTLLPGHTTENKVPLFGPLIHFAVTCW